MDRLILNVEQGSKEWHEARLSRVTSSCFADVLKTSRTKGVEFGDTAMKYLYSLIGQRFTGQWEEIKARPLEWGTSHEPLAIKHYEEQVWEEVQKIGFIQMGDFIGSSTDGLVGSNGMIEVKCPYSSKNHVNYYLNGIPKEYVPQVQGGMWVAEREWCDFITFDPRFIKKEFRIKVHRYYRDEKYIKALEKRVLLFVEMLEVKIIEMENTLSDEIKDAA